MGEKEPEKSQGGDKKSGDGGGAVTVVLKVDLHCEGCAQKVKKSLKHLNGVETVKTDFANNKVTVTGKVNPVAVKEKVEEKTKKKVELVSPQPPKKDKEGDAPPAGDAKKPDEKAEKKPDEAKKVEEKKPKEVPVITVVLKTTVHCDGCAYKMKKIISKYEGVQDVNVDLSKDQITIKGTMDMKEMLPYLNNKLKRPVDVVPPPAKKDDADKKPKEGGGGGGGDGGDKKGKEEAKPAGGGGGGGGDDKKGDAKPAADVVKPDAAGGGKAVEENVAKVEIVNKMEHYGYPYGYGAHTYNPQQPHENGYVAEYWHAPQEYVHAPPPYYAHAPPQYMQQGPQFMAGPSYAPQMFSDENPNACSIM